MVVVKVVMLVGKMVERKVYLTVMLKVDLKG